MIERIVRAIGQAIDHISRQCLRRAYGLRMPAARMRIMDRMKDREYVSKRLEEACDDVAYWQRQLAMSTDDLNAARGDFVALAVRACRLGDIRQASSGNDRPFGGAPQP